MHLDVAAKIGVPDADTAGVGLQDLGLALHVGAALNESLGRLKSLVGRQQQTVGVENQGVASDAGLALVGPRESPVDHQQLAAGLDGTLAAAHLDRHMPVDNVRRVRIHAEPHHDTAHGLFLIAESVVSVALLNVSSLVVDKVTLKAWLPNYTPKAACRYVIESWPGTFDKVHVGDVVEIKTRTKK